MQRKTYRTPHEIAVRGFEAIVEKLRPGGALQFIHQYETGRGDYTKERRAILKGVTLKLFLRHLEFAKIKILCLDDLCLETWAPEIRSFRILWCAVNECASLDFDQLQAD